MRYARHPCRCQRLRSIANFGDVHAILRKRWYLLLDVGFHLREMQRCCTPSGTIVIRQKKRQPMQGNSQEHFYIPLKLGKRMKELLGMISHGRGLMVPRRAMYIFLVWKFVTDEAIRAEFVGWYERYRSSADPDDIDISPRQ